ncbi:hypothetical protein [Enterococcus faecium]|uniref:hypothetical protein n=2 Tax=Enterococcus faecium TaxID=1352 RepID=UPI00191473CE|nr:hypothetical protein [Enterococcus faecium]MBK5028736.1 hypothetical protein [Enterococcus faecium]MBK5039435.1 hypothetical protein [Enterococcus faecium]MBK5044286.1 hypothetical protein [Enterococcus faecium]MBK5132660.1 hypothetical protein [Enterococcus faecium]MBK5140008.1 hypothetical protein [Enterococcus faecium]
MENNQMNLLGQRKKYGISSWMTFSLSALAVILLFQLVFPMEAFADIQSSVNHAGDSITKLVRNITAAVGTAVIASAFLANMLPIIEISQKAKMVIIRAGFSILGISFASQIVDWVMSIK